jgi:mRNA-degrading endonuclease RelE of RelBE toxin-antitoxin system
MVYRIIFAESARAQIQSLTASQRKTVLEAVEQQLTHEPLVETRNRKLLRPNPIAPWELRVGQLRVFYDVTARPDSEAAEAAPLDQDQQGEVQILAVGQKRGNVLRIAGKVIQL